jgi:hypothetical protein
MGNPQEWVNYKPNGWSKGAGPTHYPTRAFTRAQTAPPFVLDSRADGGIALERPEGCAAFIAMCHQLRFWRANRLCNTCSGQGAEGAICCLEDLSTSWHPFLRVRIDRRP